MVDHLRDIIEWTDGTDNYIEQLMKKVEFYDKIIIFGAGKGGIETLHLLQNGQCADKMVSFSDNNKEKIGKDYAGYPVIAPEDIQSVAEKTLVLISSTAYNIIREQLIQLGVDKQDIMYFQPAGMLLQKGSMDIEFIKDNIEKYEMAGRNGRMY